MSLYKNINAKQKRIKRQKAAGKKPEKRNITIKSKKYNKPKNI